MDGRRTGAEGGFVIGYLVAAVVCVGVLAGAYLKGRSDGGAIVRSEYAQRDLKAAQDYAAKEKSLQEAYRAKEANWQERFVSASRTYQKGLASAHTQRLADIAAIDAGTLRLRDPGTDSKACGSQAASTASNSSGHHGSEGAYLSSKAAGFLLGLTAEADSVVLQLSACQQILRNERN